MKMPITDDLKRDQLDALNIPLNENCIVTGPPGSGKTVVALYRAHQAMSTGKNTKLITYNNVLSQYSKTAAQSVDLIGEQDTFHKWFPRLYRSIFNRLPPEIERWQYDWGSIFLAMGDFILTEGSETDVIIDEGQDLPPEFYLFANKLGATTSIFADENQRITKTQSTLREIINNSGIGSVLYLKQNFRNTRQIAELANFISQRTGTATVTEAAISVTALDERREGESPECLENSDMDDTISGILRMSLNFNQDNIGVFVRTRNQVRQIVEKIKAIKENDPKFADISYSYYMSGDQESGINWEIPGIKVITFASCKGVEFDTVWIPELDKLRGTLADPTDPTTARLFYTAVTRARDRLVLAYSGTGKPRILDLFPSDLVDYTEDAQVSQILCPKCSKENPAGHKFCGWCGTSMKS